MSYNQYKTKEAILKRGLEIVGIPLKEVDKYGRLTTGKGAIGNVIEESWFEYKINSKSEPDFPEAGVELKATPYLRTKKDGSIRAKERLVCNIINYMTEYQAHSFQESSFYKKCKSMLIMAYEYLPQIPKGDFTIDKVVLFEFPLADLKIIEEDWKKIVRKIQWGKAHNISEGDTLYLGACTKGQNANSMREQPHSPYLAKQRAFCLKQSYMTYILNNYIFGNQEDERIIKDVSALGKYSFEEYIFSKTAPYIGLSQAQLLNAFNLKTNAKNTNELLLAHMLGVRGRVSKTEEFQKANIIPKTIKMDYNGFIRESMSFPAFNPKKLVEETWENCEFKSMLEQAKFLFVVFRYNEQNDLIFDNLIFWNMPKQDLNQVKLVWNRTVNILKNGVIFEARYGRTYNNLPKASQNRVCHVRPHARNAQDTFELPDGNLMPKQCFWLNNTYIESQIAQDYKFQPFKWENFK